MIETPDIAKGCDISSRKIAAEYRAMYLLHQVNRGFRKMSENGKGDINLDSYVTSKIHEVMETRYGLRPFLRPCSKEGDLDATPQPSNQKSKIQGTESIDDEYGDKNETGGDVDREESDQKRNSYKSLQQGHRRVSGLYTCLDEEGCYTCMNFEGRVDEDDEDGSPIMEYSGKKRELGIFGVNNNEKYDAERQDTYVYQPSSNEEVCGGWSIWSDDHYGVERNMSGKLTMNHDDRREDVMVTSVNLTSATKRPSVVSRIPKLPKAYRKQMPSRIPKRRVHASVAGFEYGSHDIDTLAGHPDMSVPRPSTTSTCSAHPYCRELVYRSSAQPVHQHNLSPTATSICSNTCHRACPEFAVPSSALGSVEDDTPSDQSSLLRQQLPHHFIYNEPILPPTPE